MFIPSLEISKLHLSLGFYLSNIVFWRDFPRILYNLKAEPYSPLSLNNTMKSVIMQEYL
jgi:hypothetical protein